MTAPQRADPPTQAPAPEGTVSRAGAPLAADAVPADLANHPRYRITRLLGQGGMGAVYEAEHRLMERTVALKVIHRQFTADAAAVERFRREVKTAARLHHPNIVTAYDADQAGDTHFLVMEFVPGQSLAARLRDGPPLPVREACDFARQAALGLQYAHEQGMVHRDVKPDNLMLSDGRVKILDFGLARFAQERAAGAAAQAPTVAGEAPPGQLTAVGAVMGTPDYIAPEQASNAHAADVRADIYSLGCTLYQMLTGRVPYPEGTAIDKIVRHTTDEPVPLTALRPDVPPALAAVVRRMMARAPADRYATPAEVADALAAFVRPKTDRPRRLRLIVAAAASLLIILAAGTTGFLFRGGHSSATRRDTHPSPALPELLVPDANELASRESAADALKRDSIPEPLRADLPTEVVAVLGSGGFRVPGETRLPAFHPGGKLLAAASEKDIVLFDLETGLPQRVLTGHHSAQVFSLAFDRDGTLLASGDSDGRICLWDRQFALVRSWQGHGNLVSQLAFSPDGKALASASYDKTVRLWRVADGSVLHIFGHDGAAWSVAFSPDGKAVASGTCGDSVRLWEVATEKELHAWKLGIESGYGRVAFSPDGKRLAAGLHDETRCWELPTYREVIAVKVPASGLLAFTPDGQTLVTVSGQVEGSPTTVSRLDAQSGDVKGKFDVPQSGDGWAYASLSADGRTVALGIEGWRRVLVLGADTGKPRVETVGHGASVQTVAFSPDGTRLASAASERAVRVWDLATGRELFALTDHTAAATAVAYSPDRKLLATGGFDKTVRLWDADTGQARGAPLLHPEAVEVVAFSPGGALLATGCANGEGRLWDVRTRTPLHLLSQHGDRVYGLAFEPSGRRLASCAWDGTARTWDVATGRLLEPVRRHDKGQQASAQVWAVDALPDGKRFATAGNDGTVRLWPWEGGAPGETLLTFAGSASALAAHPDGRLLAAAGDDGTVRLCDLTAAPPRQRTFRLYPRPASIAGIAFSPEGRYLATANPDGTVYVLRLANRGEVPRVPE